MSVASPGASFASIYAAHRDPVLRLAHLLCGDSHLAEDVTADAFASTWRRWERGDVDDVGAYVRRAVVNNLNTFWRRRAVRRRREAHRVVGDARGQHGTEERLADRDAVLGAIDALPSRQRHVVVLRFYEQLSFREIGEAMGISEATARSHLHRASKVLRTHLDLDPPPAATVRTEGARQ